MYDTVIVGGGPAGFSAAIYASRRGLKTLLITKDIGGQMISTNEIENYPGLGLITGVELGKKFFSQAKEFGTEFLFDEVKSITRRESEFKIETAHKNIEAKTVILALGKQPRELGVPGEERLRGRGVSYCATCDAPFYKNKIISVIGDGNSALYSALASAKVAAKVYLIIRGNSFNGEQILVDKVSETPNIEVIKETTVAEIIGDKKVESLVFTDKKTFDTDGIIIEIGHVIDSKLLKDFVKLNSKGEVVIDSAQKTNLTGLFAAGDLTDTPYKQIVVAAAEGTKAALSAFDYLQNKR